MNRQQRLTITLIIVIMVTMSMLAAIIVHFDNEEIKELAEQGNKQVVSSKLPELQ